MTTKIEAASPDSPDAVELINELDAYLDALPYTADSRHAYSVDKLLREGVAFFVLKDDGEAVGCGGLKLFGTEYGEVKRMYVRPDRRGSGFGRQILDYLAAFARENGANLLRLETGIYQVEAIAAYERYGFQRRQPFGEYEENPLSLYFEKRID